MEGQRHSPASLDFVPAEYLSQFSACAALSVTLQILRKLQLLTSNHLSRLLGRGLMPRLVGAPLLLIILLLPIDNSFAQTAVNLFGSSTPAVADSGDSKAVVVGVKIFSDVAGQVRGCSFYKALTNTGVHTVSLGDSVGTLLATEAATGETASGRQSVMFVTPVSIAAKQVFTCGYFAPNGHYSDDTNAFAVQKDVSPLHVPAEGGVYRYGTTPTAWPTYVAQASNYGVDVVFAPLSGVATWISAANVNTTTSGATITWNTAVPSDSQVEYGATTSYGNTTPLASARVTSHSVALTALIAGSPYHFRVRSRDSDAVTAIGLDYTFALPMPVSISVSPLVASISSGTTQQFMATVSNTANASVIWSATAGTVSSSGLFTAPTVSAATPVTVTATSQADASKRALVTLTVNPSAPVLNVSPLNLSFSAQTGSSNLTPASVSITNTGGGSLTFTGVSDQPWLVLSAGS